MERRITYPAKNTGLMGSAMVLPNVHLHRTTSLKEAAELLRRHGSTARVLAGGTDLLLDLKSGRVSADHVISINAIEELKGLSFDDRALALRIGSLTTIADLDESPLLQPDFAPIRDATRVMAVPQIRNLATVGGNVSSAVPCADLPPILMAMNASVELRSSARSRTLLLARFIVGVRQTAREADELLAAVVVPKRQPGFGAAYARFGLREGNAIAVASVAAALSLAPDGTIARARLVLGAVAPIPKPAVTAAHLLEGTEPRPERFAEAARAAREEAQPISDVRASADYRRELVEVLTRRALAGAYDRARESLA